MSVSKLKLGVVATFLVAVGVLASAAVVAQTPSLLPMTLDGTNAGITVVTCSAYQSDEFGFNTPYPIGLMDTRAPTYSAPPSADTPWVPPMYHNEYGSSEDVWNYDNLGQLFGVALGGFGDSTDIYATTTVVYGYVPAGSSPTIVHRISGTDGHITRNLAPSPGSAMNEAGLIELPGNFGLGNISYSYDYHRLYVTNFEDGKIYVLDPHAAAGSLLIDVYDPFEPDDSGDAPAPPHERLFAVQAHGCRLYVGTWESAGDPGQVWSMKLDESGNIVPASERLELIVPTPGFDERPIADISFSADGDMLIGERGMYAIDSPAAGIPGIVEFTWDSTTMGWVPADNFTLGYPTTTVETYAGGGVDYDCQEEWDGNLQGRHVYATTEMRSPLGTLPTFGVQLFAEDGTGMSHTIDSGVFDDEIKTWFGDVETMRPMDCFSKPAECEGDPPQEEGCFEQLDSQVICATDGDGASEGTWNITINLEVQNPGGVALVLIADPDVSGVSQFVNGAMGDTVTLEFDLTPPPGTEGTYCFDITSFDAQGEYCCAQELCVELEPCSECFVGEMQLECVEVDGQPFWNLTADLTSLSPDTIEHVFIAGSVDGDGLYLNVPTTNTGDQILLDTLVPYDQILTGGDDGCVFITLHDESLGECCWDVICDPDPVDCFEERVRAETVEDSAEQQMTSDQVAVVGCDQTRNAPGCPATFAFIVGLLALRRRR